MRVSRIFTPQALTPGSEISLQADPSRHLLQVLRLKHGADVCLFNGDGHDYPSTITATGKGNCRLSVTSRGKAEAPARLQINLCIGISRPDRMDFALQKAVELGVSRIQPLLSEYSNQRQRGDWQTKKMRHWQHIIINACQQSGRRRLPELLAVQSLIPWLQPQPSGTTALLLLPHANNHLTDIPPPDEDEALSLLVGPEGGLSRAEVEQAMNAGYQAIRLGPRILRTETAPLAAIAAIQTLWGDFSG